MGKVFSVAVREYVETVKTKAFLVNLLLVPVLVVGVMLFTARMGKKMESGPQPTRRYVVADRTRELLKELDPLVENYNRSRPHRRIVLEPAQSALPADADVESERLKRLVRERKLDGYLVLPEDLIGGKTSAQAYVRTDEIAGLQMLDTLQRLLTDAVIARRCLRHGLSPALVSEVRRGVALQPVDAGGKSGKPAREEVVIARLMIPFFFMFLMFMGIFGSNHQILTSVIEEKGSRVAEVLLSAISPFQLMAGKIVGLSAVGLTTVALWGAVSAGAAAWKGVSGGVSAYMATCFLIYYVMGFVLFAALFAAIGSACNTLKEAQTMVMPVSLIIVLPMVGWFYFVQHPTSFWTTALSFVPLLTPMLMMLRLAARPDLPLLQVFASMAVLGISVPLTVWASAKVFRTGVLMYGKPPTLRELLRWVRQ